MQRDVEQKHEKRIHKLAGEINRDSYWMSVQYTVDEDENPPVEWISQALKADRRSEGELTPRYWRGLLGDQALLGINDTVAE
jgi:hypothetical protein